MLHATLIETGWQSSGDFLPGEIANCQATSSCWTMSHDTQVYGIKI